MNGSRDSTCLLSSSCLSCSFSFDVSLITLSHVEAETVLKNYNVGFFFGFHNYICLGVSCHVLLCSIILSLKRQEQRAVKLGIRVVMFSSSDANVLVTLLYVPERNLKHSNISLGNEGGLK